MFELNVPPLVRGFDPPVPEPRMVTVALFRLTVPPELFVNLSVLIVDPLDAQEPLFAISLITYSQ